jgi:hypothetical protein
MTKKQPAATVLAVKGFDKDWTCRGVKFEVGQTYEHSGKVTACESGFHACENPLDVWSYYGPCESRFAVVELSGEMSRHEGDSKIAAAKIHIQAELSLPDFIKRAVAWIIERAKSDSKVQAASGDYSRLAASGDNSQLAASGDNSQLAASGDSSQLAASGDSSRLATSGDYSRLATSGDSSRLATSGDYSRLATSGDNSQLAASGYYSRLAASGDNSQLAASGYYSQLAASGDYSQLAASGDYSRLATSGGSSRLAASGANSVIASSAYRATAKGAAGTWIALAEFDHSGKCSGFATGCIGQGGLKPDVWYRAHGGKLVEAI